MMPVALERFRTACPGVVVRVVDGPNQMLLGQLRVGGLDLVLGRLAEPEQMTGLSFEHLYSERIAFAVDGTMFTDRSSDFVFRTSELDLTLELIGRLGDFELHVAYERDLPVDRPGLVQQFIYTILGWSFDIGKMRKEPPPRAMPAPISP